jgi:LysM repeat protein
MTKRIASLRLIPTLLMAAVGILYFLPLTAAPKRYDSSDEATTAVREMRATLDDVRHEVDNHEAEIHIFENRLSTQEITLDSLRQHILDATQANKEMVRSSSNDLETKVNSLDNTFKGLVADLKQLKNHANDSSALIERYEQRIAKLEKVVDVQNRNIAALEAALHSIASAFDLKETAIPSSAGATTSSAGKVYVVKPGDSLEKIARQNGTTIKAIKELNQLSSDKITVGKKLALPE